MRNVVLMMTASIDGYVAAPHGHVGALALCPPNRAFLHDDSEHEADRSAQKQTPVGQAG
jgi:hypothetical protein